MAPNHYTTKRHRAKPVAKIGLVTLLLALSTCAQGTTVLMLDPNWSDYVMYNYTDVYGVAQTDIAIGPYSATLNGGGYNNTAVYLFCYDFNSPTYIGTAYNGTMDVVTDFTGPTRTAMMEASYLIYELAAAGMNNAPLSVKGAISLAIWEIMNPSSNTALSQFPTDPAALPYEAAAATVVANGTWTIADAMLYPVWVPDNPSIQRFGIVVAGSPPVPPNTPETVPEPGTLLVGAGLVGLATIGRKLRA